MRADRRGRDSKPPRGRRRCVDAFEARDDLVERHSSPPVSFAASALGGGSLSGRLGSSVAHTGSGRT
jgi:hypothetical protein